MAQLLVLFLCSAGYAIFSPSHAEKSSDGNRFWQEFVVELDSLRALENEPLELNIDKWILENSVQIRFKFGDQHNTVTLNEWTVKDSRSGDIAIDRQELLRIMEYAGIEYGVIKVYYDRLPINLRLAYFRRILVDDVDQDYLPALVLADSLTAETRISRPAAGQDLFGSTNIQRSGSITRGITVGTNQDASLESGLRFELSGNITDDIEIIASLTDQSTPIQPDGTTQNLREFDRVFIQLSHRQGQLQLGDVDVALDRSDFARINRRLQGAEVQLSLDSYGDWQAAAAVVRGRFRAMTFSGLNGVQGPYRLTGSNNETFIIVLAGTERVWLNGQLLTRGEENDYVIDYALGEITFTNRRMIGTDSRITVDFQYVTQEYNRTLITTETEHAELLGGRLAVGASFIRESDSRSLNAEEGLTDEELRILREAGADVENAVISGAENVGFRADAGFILYVQADTTFQGNQFTIFRAAPEDTSAVWRVRFSRVGDGLGSYRRASSTLNGIVYEWVGPGLGSYEPFRRIPAPRQQQMLAVRTNLDITPKVSWFTETAVSELDVNRFSQTSESVTQSVGYITGLRVDDVETLFGKVSARLVHRYTGNDFSFFDRVRDAEFDRIWNLPASAESRELFTSLESDLVISPFSSLSAGAGYIERPDISSFRVNAGANVAGGGLPQLRHQADYVFSEYLLSGQESSWLRYSGDSRYSTRLFGLGITPGLRAEAEQRRQIFGDDLLPGSFRFAELAPGLQVTPTERVTIGYTVGYRQDENQLDGRFAREAITLTHELNSQLQPSDNLDFTAGIIYREKELFQASGEPLIGETIKEESALLRLSADYRSQGNALQIQWQYEAGTERRPLLQETYIEVGPELGNYIWIDLNGDGVQQLDEFFPEQTPGEGIYLRQFVPSDELIPVTSLNTRIRSRLDPGRIIDSRFWKNIALNSLFELREQNRGASLGEILLLNPAAFLNSQNTIDGRLFWQQELQLLREVRRADVRLRYNQLRGLNQRTSGGEKQFSNEFGTDSSYRFASGIQVNLETAVGRREVSSDNLGNRSFTISYTEAEPSVRYTFSRSLQAGFGTALALRSDTRPEQMADATEIRIFSDFRLFYQNTLQTFARAELRSNEVSGSPTPGSLIELTDGSGTGRSVRWSMQATYRISQYLRANINYDGRTVSTGPAIQTLRFTLNAVF
ncbi:MAG: hypothetical protein LAT67_00060 [Balneolales bacterium]|nr:hypothetical protein [Balneolales bacterium]